ncbi:MAG: hypothetical protein PUC50_08450 [Bacteroidales bacterium]|nr:hypothetical protein [Bacteroidales bacterium]
MKIAISIIAILAMTIQVGFCQELDTDRIKKEWITIINDFVSKLQSDTTNFHPKNESVIKMVAAIKKLKFNGKNFNNLKDCKMDFNIDKKQYDAVANKYIRELESKYEVPKDKKSKKESICSVDSITILLTQNDSLNNIIIQLRNDSIKSHNQILSLRQSQTQTEEKEKSFFDNWPWFIIIGLLLALTYFLLKKWYQADKQNGQLHDVIKTLKVQKQSTDFQLQSLKKQKQKEKIIEKEVIKTVYVEKNEKESPKEVKYQYLSQLNSANGGYFKRVQGSYDSSSFYRMFDSDGTQANFEFNGDMERAIKNWSSVLDPASDYDGDTDTASRIENIAPGIIQYDSSSERWQIIKKANLKLF